MAQEFQSKDEDKTFLFSAGPQHQTKCLVLTFCYDDTTNYNYTKVTPESFSSYR